MMTDAISVENLSCAYRNQWTFHQKTIISNLSFNVKPGTSFGFIGHNGAGKTTTIKCILNFIKPQTGTIKIFGEESSSIAARKLIGYLPELPYFYDHLNVNELLSMFCKLLDIPAKERVTAIKESLDAVNFQASLSSKLKNLSKGQLQRIAMAQAILHKPKLLILDEPFSGLDPLGRNDFLTLLQRLKEEGTTIFISSHILNDVETLCDEVAILKLGQLIGCYNTSSIADLLNQKYEICLVNSAKNQDFSNGLVVEEHGTFLKLIFDSKDEAENKLKQALNDNLEIISYQRQPASLQNLFIKLTNEEQQKGAQNV